MDTSSRKENEVRIIIGADIVPTVSNQDFFEKAEMERLVDDNLFDVLNNADYRIFNLEVPLTDKETPINKCGPNLIASAKSVEGLKQIGTNFLTLANNHILDQGVQGLMSTIEQLNYAGIAYGGVGMTPHEAVKPYIVDIKGVKAGIYCCAEHEFSIVNDKKAGANPFDPLESFDHVKQLKTEAEYVVVLYHGGKEHYRYPSPNLQRICRKFIEKGADLVVCQHSHCIGCEEKWYGGRIVYGQGNFLFDHSESEFWQTSLLISIDIEKHFSGMLKTNISYVPLRKMKETVRLAEYEDRGRILDEFHERSALIGDPDFVKDQYQKFANSMIYNYLEAFTGRDQRNIFFRVVNKLSNYRYGQRKLRKKYGKEKRLAIRNFVECEAHRELLIEGLSDDGPV